MAEQFERPLGVLFAPQQGRQDHVVADHGRECDGLDDDHAGGGRGTADERQQRQTGMSFGQRQVDHEGVRHHPAGQVQHAGQSNGDDEQRGENEVGRKHPAGHPQIPAVGVLHHGDVELARQAHQGGHGHAHLHQQTGPLRVGLPECLQLRRGQCLAEQIARPIEQAPGDEGANREEGQQFDQRFEGHRQHHATVVLGDIQAAGAEQNGEQGQHQADDQGRVLGAGARRVGTGSGEQVDAEDDGFELQGDIGQHADQADQRHHHRQWLRLAVACGDKVGNRGDVFLLADGHHFLQHPGGKQHQQHRAQVNRQERPQLVGGLADGTEEGPTGAIHRQRQGKHPGAQARGERRLAPVAPEGDGEQNGHVDQSNGGDQSAGQRHAGSRREGMKVLHTLPQFCRVGGVVPAHIDQGLARP